MDGIAGTSTYKSNGKVKCISNGKVKCVVDKFTNGDDEEVIEIIACYKILWKLSHPDYKSNIKKYME